MLNETTTVVLFYYNASLFTLKTFVSQLSRVRAFDVFDGYKWAHDVEQSVAQDDSLPPYLLAVAVAGYLNAFLSRFLLLVSAIGTDDSVNRRRATKNVGDRNYGLAPLIFNGPGANHAYETTAKYMRHYETMSPKAILNELNRNQGN